MAKQSGAGRSVRQLRVGEEIRHALAEILSRDLVHDPSLEGRAITVSEVHVSPDVRRATAYVIPLMGVDQDAVIEALNQHAPFIRGCLGKAVYLKHVPQVEFELDRTFDEADKIEHLLARLKDKRRRDGDLNQQ